MAPTLPPDTRGTSTARSRAGARPSGTPRRSTPTATGRPVAVSHATKDVSAPSSEDLRRAEPQTRLHVHEQHRVRVRGHEAFVGYPVLEDLTAQRQAEGSIAPGTDPQVCVGLGGRRRERRIDHHEPRTPFDGVEQEMHVRDARLHRVRSDEEQEPAVRPVLRLVLGVLDAEGDGHPHRQVAVEVEARAVAHAEQGGGPVVRTLLDVARRRALGRRRGWSPSPTARRCPAGRWRSGRGPRPTWLRGTFRNRGRPSGSGESGFGPRRRSG